MIRIKENIQVCVVHSKHSCVVVIQPLNKLTHGEGPNSLTHASLRLKQKQYAKAYSLLAAKP